jgi:restriction system protein
MAKLKKTARTSKTASGTKQGSQDQAERLGKSITESAQQIWLAGMGAFNRAQAEGGKLFESLVRDGLSLEQTARKLAGNRANVVRDVVEGRVGQARERAVDTWDKLEKVFEDRVQRALVKLGVPGRDDLNALTQRVERLTEELRKANGGSAPKAPKAHRARRLRRSRRRRLARRRRPRQRRPPRPRPARLPRRPRKPRPADPSKSRQSVASLAPSPCDSRTGGHSPRRDRGPMTAHRPGKGYSPLPRVVAFAFMSPILIALLVFVVLGLAATAWLRRSPSPLPTSQANARGAAQLGTLRWRDFTRLVLQAMHGRGYRTVVEDGMPADGIPTDGGDIVLERGGERTLLSVKYGSASVVGAQALLGLGGSATLRGTQKVIVVTPGRFDEEAIRMARQQDIELIDGEDLWPEVRPYVARPTQQDPGATPAPVRSRRPPIRRRMGIAWGGAAVAAVAWMIAQGLQPAASNARCHRRCGAGNDARRKQRRGQRPPRRRGRQHRPTDPAALERRRKETANAISTLFGVDRAFWSTQSTLLVYLSTDVADPSSELCPLLERYPELAASRVQLQPPQGSTKSVRFKQCRSY